MTERQLNRPPDATIDSMRADVAAVAAVVAVVAHFVKCPLILSCAVAALEDCAVQW